MSTQRLLNASLANLQLCLSRFNSNTASICLIKRKKYPRLYPTTLINADGSSYTIRYELPRQIIKVCV